VNKLEFSHGADLDETSQGTAFVLRQAPEGENAMEEKKTVNANTILEDPVQTFRISKPFRSTKVQKQEEENSCVELGTSLVRYEEHLNNTFLRLTRLTPSCFKVKFISYKKNDNRDLFKQAGWSKVNSAGLIVWRCTV
jgi:hypothetical protein